MCQMAASTIKREKSCRLKMVRAAVVSEMSKEKKAEAVRIAADVLELYKNDADIAAKVIKEFEKMVFLRFESPTPVCLPLKTKWHCIVIRDKKVTRCCSADQARTARLATYATFKVGETGFFLYQMIHGNSTNCPQSSVQLTN